jgi:hypothetical protein
MLLAPILLVAGMLTCALSVRPPAVVSPVESAAFSQPVRVPTPRPPAPRASVGRVVPGTPCTVAAAACVDLTTQRAWLIDHGKVVRGPVPVHSGGPDRATPQGTFTVSWKDRMHVSREQGGMAMPDSVFFATGGVAFHEGPLARSSAGCVHLRPDDAAAFYTALNRGAQVQVRAPGGDTASKAPTPAPVTVQPKPSHPSPRAAGAHPPSLPAAGARGKTRTQQAQLKQTQLKQTQLKQTQLKQTQLKQTQLKQTQPKQAQPKQAQPKQTQPTHVQPGIPGVPAIGPAPRSNYLRR